MVCTYSRHLPCGGIHTIFRFISGFAERGMAQRIVIYGNRDASLAALRSEVAQAFPHLGSAEFVLFDIDQDRVDDLPPTDIGICTFWVSAYLLLRFNRVRRKYYFIQDYESLFYRTRPMSALAESTYRFGFTGIVNTPGLLHALERATDSTASALSRLSTLVTTILLSVATLVKGRESSFLPGRPSRQRLRTRRSRDTRPSNRVRRSDRSRNCRVTMERGAVWA